MYFFLLSNSFRYPFEEAAAIAISTVKEFANDFKEVLCLVLLVFMFLHFKPVSRFRSSVLKIQFSHCCTLNYGMRWDIEIVVIKSEGPQWTLAIIHALQDLSGTLCFKSFTLYHTMLAQNWQYLSIEIRAGMLPPFTFLMTCQDLLEISTCRCILFCFLMISTMCGWIRQKNYSKLRLCGSKTRLKYIFCK